MTLQKQRIMGPLMKVSGVLVQPILRNSGGTGTETVHLVLHAALQFLIAT